MPRGLKAFHILMFWIAVLKSGVHATLAGVALAAFIPTGKDARDKTGLTYRLEHGLHPWVVFLILPVFAFANAGVPILGLSLEDLLQPVPLGIALGLLDLVSSGLLLGTTMAAMLLGHWYLNTPSMQLIPLKRLVVLMVIAVSVRTLLCATGLALQAGLPDPMPTSFWIFIVFRWLSGLLGVFMLSYLAWETLRVPNTQSATGILYAGVILSFIGELTSQLLTVDTLYPV